MRFVLGTLLIYLITAVSSPVPPGPAVAAVSLPGLVAELNDLHGLAIWPEPNFEVVSHVHLPSQGRGSGGPVVLCDVKGPGALVHLCSPSPSAAGEVRFEVDDRLVVTAPLAELLSGMWMPPGFQAPPVPPPLAETRGGSGVWRLPVPFARRLRLLAQRPDVEVRVECRHYSPGTEVIPFSLEQVRTTQEQIVAVAQRLNLGMPQSPPAATRHRRTGGRRLAPSERLVLVDWVGAGAIEYVHLQFTSGPDTLRPVLLRGRFDAAERPQLLCPILDFFGAGPASQPRTSLAASWRADGSGVSRWVMPFAHSCRLELVNVGTEPVEVRLEAVIAEWPWTERSLHFHARWQQLWPVPARPARWLTVCELRGMSVLAGQQWRVLNPSETWWGDGRERLSLDDQSPREGIGAAGWFGMALDDQARLDGVWMGQEREAQMGHRGWSRTQRLLTLDRVPLRRRLLWEVELRPWDAKGSLALLSTTFWYARPGGSHGFPAIAVEALQNPPCLPDGGQP